jgi:hypothetical protein
MRLLRDSVAQFGRPAETDRRLTVNVLVRLIESALTADRATESCGCRLLRPRRSSGMCVLVEGAAESITSMDVQQVELVGSDDRFGNWPQGCCAV